MSYHPLRYKERLDWLQLLIKMRLRDFATISSFDSGRWRILIKTEKGGKATNSYPVDMKAANCKYDEQQKTFEQQVCNSAGLTAGLRVHLTFLSGVNSFLSITAFVGN